LQSGLSPLLRFIARHLVSLGVIALVLVAGKTIVEEVQTLHAARSEQAVLRRIGASVAASGAQEAARADSRVASYRNAPLEALDARIGVLDAALRRAAPPATTSLLTLPLPKAGDMAERVAADLAGQMQREIARQELAHLELLRAYLHAGRNKEGARARLEQLRAAHVQAYERYLVHKQAASALGWMSQQLLVNGVIITPRLAALHREREQLIAASEHARNAYQLQARAMAQLDAVKAASSFSVDRARLDALAAPLRATLAKTDEQIGNNLISKLWTPLAHVLPLAALILALSLLAHLALKALFYFVLAPLASRRKPIVLNGTDTGQLGSAAAISSAVSQSLRLGPDEELIVLPDYVQSSPAGSDNRTRWLLDWSRPWTSLIAGMVGLTAIRTKGGEPIVLSASDDAMSEIAVLVLPAGSGMVLQPRCLVGVVAARDTPLRITSHWRLGSLHAWLTLQLRYLVFHGPATLIVKGSRGVRVEPAGHGRLISQASTLGFSSGLAYSTVRSETFYPYYKGRTALLQDRFEGNAGYYVYDETPRGGKKGNVLERGLEGFSDAVLKVFGI
jgi:hypothetical protein